MTIYVWIEYPTGKNYRVWRTIPRIGETISLENGKILLKVEDTIWYDHEVVAPMSQYVTIKGVPI